MRRLLPLCLYLPLFLFLVSGEVKSNAAPQAPPAKGTGVYQVEPFVFVYPATKFDGAGVKEVSVRMARNEYEPVTFAVVSNGAGFPSVTAEIDEPTDGKGNRIRNDDLDLRAVKVWKQSGTNWWPSKNLLPGADIVVPELLLKDDTVPFNDSWQGTTYIPPVMPSVFKTSLEDGVTRQLWLTVRTDPARNPAGTYKGAIRLISNGKAIATVNLSITVLPIILPDPGKELYIYFKGRVSPGDMEYVEKENYMGQLADIKRHGFNGISVWEGKPEDMKEAIQRASQAGFKKVVAVGPNQISPDVFADILKFSDSLGVELYFYGVDEPEDQAKLERQIKKSMAIHSGGGKVVTAITKKTDALLDDPASMAYKSFPAGTLERLDWPNYNMRTLKDYTDALMDGRASKTHNRETYYWQIMQENPSMHRLYSGFFLWRTGLDGIFPYCYQAFYPISPYNGGDRRFVKGIKMELRAFDVTYPEKGGSVPTLQWEAIREGIDDLRYLKALTDRAAKNGTDAKKDIDSVLSGFNFNYAGVDNIGVAPVKLEDFRKAREKIIELILKTPE